MYFTLISCLFVLSSLISGKLQEEGVTRATRAVVGVAIAIASSIDRVGPCLEAAIGIGNPGSLGAGPGGIFVPGMALLDRPKTRRTLVWTQ